MSVLIKTGPKPNGYFYAETLDGKVEEIDSIQCCHCGMHFPHKFDAHNIIEACSRCMKPVCTKPECRAQCVPIEKQLEEMETLGRRLINV